MEALAADIERVLDDVRAAVDRLGGDARAGRRDPRRDRASARRRCPPTSSPKARRSCRWLADNHFTFLGYRRHELVTVDGEDALKIVPGSSLGILRDERGHARSRRASRRCRRRCAPIARRPELLVVTKSTSRSTVHRPGYLDYIAVKRFDAKGDVCGEDRFLGLFTSTAYSANPAEIPLLRRKVANVVARAGLAPGSHAAQGAGQHPDTYPRDELFQTGEDDLLQTAMGILHLGERQRFRLFVRRDPFERFVVVPDLRAARELHHRAAPEVAGDPDAGVQRHELRVQRAPVGVGARAHPDHRAHDAGTDPGLRRARARGAPRRRRAALGRRSQGGADRGARRSARQRAVPAIRRAPFPPATARISRRAPRCPTSS